MNIDRARGEPTRRQKVSLGYVSALPPRAGQGARAALALTSKLRVWLMISQKKRALLTTLLAIAMPVAATAQQSPTQQQVEGWFMELQQVHQQLEGIQMQALQDPQLSAAQEELGDEIRQAIEARDPRMGERMARVEALEAEAMDAQQSGNVDLLQALVVEAQQIQEHFMTVQQEVLEQPAIATKVSSFQARLERKMVEVNPDAQNLISRFRELETMIEQALRGG
jgi:uncharacterized protein (DUF885 family)